MASITFTNGNREIDVRERNGQFCLTSNVFDGVKWQTTSWKNYKTFNTAKKAAEKQVAKISQGWTKYPIWTITEA